MNFRISGSKKKKVRKNKSKKKISDEVAHARILHTWRLIFSFNVRSIIDPMVSIWQAQKTSDVNESKSHCERRMLTGRGLHQNLKCFYIKKVGFIYKQNHVSRTIHNLVTFRCGFFIWGAKKNKNGSKNSGEDFFFFFLGFCPIFQQKKDEFFSVVIFFFFWCEMNFNYRLLCILIFKECVFMWIWKSVTNFFLRGEIWIFNFLSVPVIFSNA